MKYVKIVRQGGSYNGKSNDHPTYVLIDIENYKQLDMFFDSYAEAKKYCVKKGYKVVNQKYSLDWDFDLKKVQQFLEIHKKVKTMKKTTKLTETQQKVAKLITPMVKSLVMEASAYERGSDKNLKKEIKEVAKFLNSWDKHFDDQVVEVSDLDLILRRIDRLAKSIKLHRDNWDN